MVGEEQGSLCVASPQTSGGTLFCISPGMRCALERRLGSTGIHCVLISVTCSRQASLQGEVLGKSFHYPRGPPLTPIPSPHPTPPPPQRWVLPAGRSCLGKGVSESFLDRQRLRNCNGGFWLALGQFCVFSLLILEPYYQKRGKCKAFLRKHTK